MLSEKKAGIFIRILTAVFIAVLSISVLAVKIPDTGFVSKTVGSLEESKNTVIKFVGVTLVTSTAITALPDDFATPIADTLADMNKYFVIILVVLALERLLVIEGVKVAFLYVIPIACGIYIAGYLIKKEALSKFGKKLALFGLALILVVPFSTRLTDLVGADYKKYVEDTITETDDGAGKINEIISGSNGSESSVLEKISNVFDTVINGMGDLVEYINSLIKRCINSIAILMVTNVVIPLLTLWFFKWMLMELFGFNVRVVMPANKAGSGCPAEE